MVALNAFPDASVCHSSILLTSPSLILNKSISLSHSGIQVKAILKGVPRFKIMTRYSVFVFVVVLHKNEFHAQNLYQSRTMAMLACHPGLGRKRQQDS